MQDCDIDPAAGVDFLTTHAGVRLFPPARAGDRWRVASLLTRTHLECSRLAASLLLSFMGGSARNSVRDELHRRYFEAVEDIDAAVDALVDLGLLVSPRNSSHVRFERILRAWARYGWVDSADYHLATLNYPFLDYADDGSRQDRVRMSDYARAAPDLDRYKIFAGARERVEAPDADSALRALDKSFSQIWRTNPELALLDRDRALTLMSAAFGQIGKRSLSNRPDLMADAILKTSPSGGARHPTEGYLFARSIDGLRPGIYHFNVKDSSLDRVRPFDLDDEQVFDLFSGPLRARFDVEAFIVLTSRFERNMYRYREPRTFRTVLMDVGHLLGTIDLVAKSLGINCLVQHGINDKKICALLGLNPLVEGVIWAVALGGAKSENARDSAARVELARS